MLVLPTALLPRVWLLKLIALVVLTAMLNGCLSMAVRERIARREEPQSSKCFFLTANEKYHTISRWWENGFESVSKVVLIRLKPLY